MPTLRGLLAGAVATALLLSGCSVPTTEDTDGAARELSFITVYPANTTEPHLVHAAFILNSGTMETLVGLDPETLEVFPWLADGWETDDAQHWEFTIREGITFHNGKPLTAAAVKASLDHTIEVNPGIATALQIESIEVTGDLTLAVTTEDVYPGLISNLVHFNAVITDVTDEGDLPIGTGAFKFESFDPAAEAVLVRNDDYWDGSAKLDRVVMTANEDANARLLALQAGDADIIYRPALESIQTLEQDASLTVESVIGSRVYHLIYNFAGENGELWNNLDFRRGIDALMDREALVDSIMGGQASATRTVFPGDYPFSPEEPERPHGTEAALAHFEAAGLDVADGQVTSGGQPIKLKIATYIARPELPLIAQVLQDAAGQIGIDMEIQVAENIDEFLPTGDFDIATYSMLTISRGDGAFFLNSAFGEHGAQNHGRLVDPELAALMADFNREIDLERRNERAREIATLIEEKQYHSYLVVPNETAAYRTGVTGWVTAGNEFEFQMITKDLDLAPDGQ